MFKQTKARDRVLLHSVCGLEITPKYNASIAKSSSRGSSPSLTPGEKTYAVMRILIRFITVADTALTSSSIIDVTIQRNRCHITVISLSSHNSLIFDIIDVAIIIVIISTIRRQIKYTTISTSSYYLL